MQSQHLSLSCRIAPYKLTDGKRSGRALRKLTNNRIHTRKWYRRGELIFSRRKFVIVRPGFLKELETIHNIALITGEKQSSL